MTRIPLASQGDEWGAQKDVLCDTFGAVCSALLFVLFNRNEQGRRPNNV